MSNGERSSGQFGSLLGLLKLLLCLAILGQVESCNFLSLLNLLLVGLDLLLKFASELRHTILILVIFILLELELLDTTLGLLESLESFTSFALAASKLNLQLPDAGLEFSHGSTSTLGSNFISLSQTLLKLSNLRLK